MVKLNPSDVANIQWVTSFESGKKWFDKLRSKKGDKPGTQKNFARALKRFSDYVKMSPDEIMSQYREELKADVNAAVEKWNEKLDLYPLWLKDKFGIEQSSAVAYFAAIKSFFKYNVAIRLTATTPEYYSKALKPVTLEDLRDKILPVADVFQRFEVMFFKDSGVSQDDALRLDIGDVKDIGDGFGYIPTTRMKELVDYETFVGPNTTEALKAALEFRKRRGEDVSPESPLFAKRIKPFGRLTPHPIQSIFERLSVKAGVEVSTHRLRKTFETYMAIAKIHPVILKYWAGHKVKKGKSDIEMKYIIPPTPEQEKLYKEAYRHLDVSPKVSAEELTEARIRSELETMSPEAAKRFLGNLIQRYTFKPKMKRLIEDIRREFDKENSDCANGVNCGEQFCQIPEDQLLSRLKEGWQIVHRLATGEIIVKKS